MLIVHASKGGTTPSHHHWIPGLKLLLVSIILVTLNSVKWFLKNSTWKLILIWSNICRLGIKEKRRREKCPRQKQWKQRRSKQTYEKLADAKKLALTNHKDNLQYESGIALAVATKAAKKLPLIENRNPPGTPQDKLCYKYHHPK